MIPRYFATQLEQEAKAALKRAGQLFSIAETLQAMPEKNAPTAEMRTLLAGLGFCVISTDALAMAELTMRKNEPEDDGLSMHAIVPSEWDKALQAVQEALMFTNHPRFA